MHATRLPGKPLADIRGRPMIVRVWQRAVAANTGHVIVATDSEEIVKVVTAAGGEAVMTRADHASGSDRVHEAVTKVDPARDASIIVNLQGDLPTLDPQLVGQCVAPLATAETAIATLAAVISEAEERTNPNVVKVVGTPIAENRLRALYFTRAMAPSGDGPLYHHIGIYAYRPTVSSASSRCRLRRWKSAKSLSNCGRSKPKCASTSRSLTLFPSVSILRPTWSAPAVLSRRDSSAFSSLQDNRNSSQLISHAATIRVRRGHRENILPR